MARSDGRSRRGLLLVAGALAAAAAALAGSAAAVWLRPSFSTPFRGQVPVAVTGGEWEPALVPLALLALAGVAAAVATGGWARRLVGLALGAGGVWAAVLGLRPQLGGPPDVARLAAVADAPAGGRLSDLLVVEPWTLLAALGGVLLVLAGAMLVLRAGSMSRLGSRYSAPGAAPRQPDRHADLWAALDAGDDPTHRPGG